MGFEPTIYCRHSCLSSKASYSAFEIGLVIYLKNIANGLLTLSQYSVIFNCIVL